MILSNIPTSIIYSAVKFATYRSQNSITVIRVRSSKCKSRTEIVCYRNNAMFKATYNGSPFVSKPTAKGAWIAIYGNSPATGLATFSSTGKSVIFTGTNSKIKAVHAIYQRRGSNKHRDQVEKAQAFKNLRAFVMRCDLKRQPFPFDYSLINHVMKGEMAIEAKGSPGNWGRIVVAKKHTVCGDAEITTSITVAAQRDPE